MVNVPVLAVEAKAGDKSVHVELLIEPCNLNVFVATFEIAQFTKSKLIPEMAIFWAAVKLNSAFPTQFTLGINADAVD